MNNNGAGQPPAADDHEDHAADVLCVSRVERALFFIIYSVTTPSGASSHSCSTACSATRRCRPGRGAGRGRQGPRPGGEPGGRPRGPRRVEHVPRLVAVAGEEKSSPASTENGNQNAKASGNTKATSGETPPKQGGSAARREPPRPGQRSGQSSRQGASGDRRSGSRSSGKGESRWPTPRQALGRSKRRSPPLPPSSVFIQDQVDVEVLEDPVPSTFSFIRSPARSPVHAPHHPSATVNADATSRPTDQFCDSEPQGSSPNIQKTPKF